MSSVRVSETSEERDAISCLFASGGPVLLEVYFPNMATSSDWYLCDDEEQARTILAKLGPGAAVRLLDVASIPAVKGEILLKK